MAKFCVQITDSPYVVVHLRITTRMGASTLPYFVSDGGESGAKGRGYIELWHSVGCPLTGAADENPKARCVSFALTSMYDSFIDSKAICLAERTPL